MTKKKVFNKGLRDIPRKLSLVRRKPSALQLNLKFSRARPALARTRHGLVLFAEFFAGIVLAVALAVAILVWRLSSGDIAVNFLATPIESAVNQQLAGYSVKVGGAVLQKSEAGHGVSFRLRNIALLDEVGRPVAWAPKAAIGIAPLMLMIGQVSTTYIDLIGPRLAIVYGRDGRLTIDTEHNFHTSRETADSVVLPADDPAASIANQFDAPTAISAVRTLLGLEDKQSNTFNSLSRIGIRDANLVFIHERLGLRWEMKHGGLNLTRREKAIAYEIQLQLAESESPWPMRMSGLVTGHDGGLMITSDLDQFVPRRSAGLIEGLGGLEALDMPISARFQMMIADDGSVSHVDMTAAVAAGFIRLTEDEEDQGILIDEGNLVVNYDAENQRIDIAKSTFYSGLNYAAIEGFIVATADEGRDIWRFDLVAKEGTLSSADIEEPPIVIDNAVFSGRYEPLTGDFWLEQGEVRSERASFDLSGRLRMADVSPELDVSLSFAPMSFSALKQIWPSFLAPGARGWINENVLAGSILDGVIEARFTPGLIADLIDGDPIPEEALKISFGFDEATIRYFRPLPLLETLSGRGAMRGGRLILDAAMGQVVVGSGGTVDNISGHLEIPVVTAATPIAYIRMKGGGKSNSVLELIDYKPLEYAQEIGVVPGDVGGDTVVELDLSIPLLRNIKFEDVNIAAKAAARNLTGRALFAGQDITNGELLIEVLPTRIEVNGEIQVSEVPVSVEWTRSFGGSRNEKGELTLRARLDRDERRKIGLDFDGVHGPVSLLARPVERADSDTAFNVELDLSESRVTFDALAWEKPSGQPSSAAFVMVRDETGQVKLENFKFSGGDALLAGELEIDDVGNLSTATLTTFRVRRDDDMALTLVRGDDHSINVNVTGRSVDASRVIRQYFSLAPGGETVSEGPTTKQINIDASIDRVRGLSNDVMTDMKMTLAVQNGLIERMSLNGQIDGSTIVTITPGTSDTGRSLNIESRNAGAALHYVGLYSRMNKGRLNVVARLPRNPDVPMRGDLVVENFSVASDAVIQEITEASQTTRVAQLQTGGLFFEKLSMAFIRTSGVVKLNESYLRGPSLGATLGGTIDFNNNKLDITGTYVPLYAVNNLLSHVPVVGQILTGGRNEGVLGVTFSVTGPVNAPAVTVNPISAIAPGMFRKLFSFSNSVGPTGSTSDLIGAITTIPPGAATPIPSGVPARPRAELGPAPEGSYETER